MCARAAFAVEAAAESYLNFIISLDLCFARTANSSLIQLSSTNANKGTPFIVVFLVSKYIVGEALPQTATFFTLEN